MVIVAHVVTEMMKELVSELGSPQPDGHSGIDSFKVTYGEAVVEYAVRECSVVWAPHPDMQASM